MAARHTHRCAIVWMRRALRVADNGVLLAAVQDADTVIPVVCLRDTPQYAAPTPRYRFIRSSLWELDAELRDRNSALTLRVGDPVEHLPRLATETGATVVYAATVYDAPTLRRDQLIASALAARGVRWVTVKDVVLFEAREILTMSGEPYRVFTPYKRAWLVRSDDAPRPVPIPARLPSPARRPGGVKLTSLPGFADRDLEGGSKAAGRRWSAFLKRGITSYDVRRNVPGIDGTSKMSCHLAHGTISIRRLFRDARAALKGADRAGRVSIQTFLGELIWREFYYQILANFPFVIERAFREEFAGLKWSTSPSAFTAWCQGHTGYPIVDAAMRQLNMEGWMHNRARMIVASFLTKDLHLDWRWGEKYFFEHLVDADIAANNGGWQWTAGTGTDASPWFRVFNPVTQGKKFDPRGTYIRRYLPELAHLPDAAIHEPWTLTALEQADARCLLGRDYPRPMIDHARERSVTLELYKHAGRQLSSPAPIV